LAPTSATLRASSIAVSAGETPAGSPATAAGCPPGPAPGWAAGSVMSVRRRSRTPGELSPDGPAAARGPGVGDRRLGGLHPGNAADPAAGVGGGAGVVQAAHRRAVVGEAGRRAHVEQLLQRQLAVE